MLVIQNQEFLLGTLGRPCRCARQCGGCKASRGGYITWATVMIKPGSAIFTFRLCASFMSVCIRVYITMSYSLYGRFQISWPMFLGVHIIDCRVLFRDLTTAPAKDCIAEWSCPLGSPGYPSYTSGG